MTDFSDIDVSETLSIPSSTLFFRELQHLVKSRSEGIDLVHWYRMDAPLPRLRIDLVSEPEISSLLRHKLIKSAAPYIEQAIGDKADYLEFIPGKEIRSYTVADVEKLEVSEAEISCLLSQSIPDIQTISYTVNGDAIRLPRLLCDSRTVKDVLERNKLDGFWKLYHFACSINAAYLEVSPFCPSK